MTQRLMTNLCKDENLNVASAKSRGEINLDFSVSVCEWLFKLRQSDLLQSRTKFKIQDLIDDYNSDWKDFLTLYRSKQPEESKKQYVPKNKILTEAQAFGKGSSRKNSGALGYIYRPKISTEKIDYKSDSASGADSGKVIKKNNNMFQLLSGLKAESASEHSSDEADAKKMDRRRISFNKRN